MMRARVVGVLFAALALVACNPEGDDRVGANGGGGAGGSGHGGDGGSAGSGVGGSGGDGGSGGQGHGGDGGSGGGAGQGGHGGNPQVGDQVLGTVIDYQGKPFAGVLAVLNYDFDAAQVTDADGRFSFDEVELPYSLTLKLPSGNLLELRQLTRREPRVAFFDNDQGLSRATLSGTIAGAETPFPAGDEIVVSTTGTEHTGSDRESFSVDGPGPFSNELSWLGPTSRTVDIVAAHITRQIDGSVAYRAGGILSDVTMEDSATISGLQIELSSAPIATFQSQIDADFGAYDDGKSSGVLSFNLLGARFGFPESFGGGTELSEVDLPEEGGRLYFSGADAGGTFAMHVVKVTSASTTSVRLPGTRVLNLLAPEEGASAVSRLPVLSWSSVPGARSYWVEILQQTSSDSGQQHQFYLPGDVTSLDFANFNSDEVKLDGSTTYLWTVTAAITDHFFDADDIADGRGMGAVRIFGIDDFSGFRTREQTFTTAP